MKYLFLYLTIITAGYLQAQDCNDANHSTNVHDSWLSCDIAPNPNSDREDSHWVSYDLGYVYSIGSTHFWNYNVSGETNRGMKNIIIDYSLDGENWTEATTTQLAEASGNANYEGEAGLHLGEIEARYILITAVDTWGSDCAGLSEIRFDLEGTVSVNEIEGEQQELTIYPNPAQQSLSIDTDLEIKELIIVSSTGSELTRMAYATQIDISYLPDGVYFLKSISKTNEIRTSRLIKQSH